MKAEEYIKGARLEEALADLHEAVRDQPADARLRRFLFQLYSVLGQWERALTQLQVLADLDADSMLLAQVFRPVIQCELLRAEVFAGKRTPVVFGQPEEWMGWLVQAGQFFSRGEWAAARDLRDRAFEAAPALGGRINDQPFEWIADADSRLGPVLEAMVDGHYYWVPIHRIQKIVSEPPEDLRDMVWKAVQFTWTNGGAACGFIPVRYPGTEGSADNVLRLARKTDWVQKDDNLYFGMGQRIITTDQNEYALLEIRQIELSASEAGVV